MVDMHSMLRGRYSRLSLAVDLLLLVCSVLFVATAFASDEVLGLIGLEPSASRVAISVAAVCAFLLSLITLRTGWKEKAALHNDARERLTRVVSTFRKARRDDGTWPVENLEDLHESYWAVMEAAANIPSSSFLGLKAKYARKKAVSEHIDDHPCCPVWLARLRLLLKGIARKSQSDNHTDHAPRDS